MMYKLTNKKFKCMPSIAFRPHLTLVEVHIITWYLWKTSVPHNNPRANFPPLRTDETLAERYFVGGRKKWNEIAKDNTPDITYFGSSLAFYFYWMVKMQAGTQLICNHPISKSRQNCTTKVEFQWEGRTFNFHISVKFNVGRKDNVACNFNF